MEIGTDFTCPMSLSAAAEWSISKAKCLLYCQIHVHSCMCIVMATVSSFCFPLFAPCDL